MTSVRERGEWRALEVAPGVAYDMSGEPLYGTYVGALGTTDLSRLARRAGLGRVRKRLSEKRWQWFSVLDEELAVGVAIARTGYACLIFAWVFDRRARELVVDHSLTLPRITATVSDHPHDGVVAATRGLFPMVMSRRGGGLSASGSWGPVSLQVAMDPGDGMSPMTAICEVPDGRTNITQKQAGLRAAGWVEFSGRRHTFGPEAVGLLDYTHGLMKHETSWRWAIGGGRTVCGERFGFNLVEGFNEGRENVVWCGGEVLGVSKARITPGVGGDPWLARSDDGLVELEMRPEGARCEDVFIGPFSSLYQQPLGAWTGRIGDREIAWCAGVGEDHKAKW